MPPTQSAPVAHIFPVGQGGHAAPPQLRSVSVPFFTASPQLAGEQVLVCGSHTPLTQSPLTTHSTHVDAAVHFFPPPIAHEDPVAFGVNVGTPATQVSSVQSLASSGVSLPSGIDFVAPAPSHTAWRQSFGVWAASALPSAAKSRPHRPALHVRVLHSVSAPGHSVAAAQGLAPPVPVLVSPPAPVDMAPPAPLVVVAPLLLVVVLVVEPTLVGDSDPVVTPDVAVDPPVPTSEES